MPTYGLIGYPLTHSWSHKYFSDKFRNAGLNDTIYRNFPLIDVQLFPTLIQHHPDLIGLNVTKPYKEKIIPYLDDLDPIAHEIGAVNTITLVQNERKPHTRGYNTDAEGFIRSADFSGITNALILGTGGASKAIAYALKKAGIQSLFVSRLPKNHETIGYFDLTKNLLRRYLLIVNATPLGMYPAIHTFPPIPYELLSKENFLYDLVYNPEKTEFLKKGERYGARIQNGLRMLEIQAELSYSIWNNDK